jgi:hypothetical protein
MCAPTLLCIQSHTPVMPQPLFLELTWHLRRCGSLLASESSREVTPKHHSPLCRARPGISAKSVYNR